VTLEGSVSEVERASSGVRVDLRSVVGIDALAPRSLRLFERPSSDDPPSGLAKVVPGQRIRVRARVRASAPLRNPGSADRARRLGRAGIGAVATLVHPALVARVPERDERIHFAAVHELRSRVGERLSEAGPGGPLLAALAVGRRGDLPGEAREAFARLGISHLLAVSGLHLALVAALFFATTRWGFSRSAWIAARADTRRLALLAALGAAALYALLAGWGVPVQRALLLLAAAALAVLGGRARARLEPLCLASLLILAREPHALFEPGAQLSFLATAALVFAAPAASSETTRLGSMLRTTATAYAATAPLAAWHLGARAPLALAVNPVAVPWTGGVLLPGALLSVFLPEGCVGDATLAALEWLAAGTLAVAEALAERAPGQVGSRPAAAWAAGAGALAVLAVWVRPTWARVGLAAGVGAMIYLAPPAVLPPLPPRVVFLDVSQGDATVVQGREGVLLVDGGVAVPGGPDLGRSAVVPALRALGIEHLDVVVASHADLDHRGGLVAVLESIPVAELWLPRGGQAEEAFGQLLGETRRRGVRVREKGAGDLPVMLGDLRVTPVWPATRAPGRPGLSRNDRSLVLRVEVGGRALLLAGDLEAAGERALLVSGAPIRADVLKLPHHGSRSSSTGAFLDAVDARVSVASAPCAGRFRMPHPEVLARARERGLGVWWTGRDGAVAVGLGDVLHAVGHGASRHCGVEATSR